MDYFMSMNDSGDLNSLKDMFLLCRNKKEKEEEDLCDELTSGMSRDPPPPPLFILSLLLMTYFDIFSCFTSFCFLILMSSFPPPRRGHSRAEADAADAEHPGAPSLPDILLSRAGGDGDT